MSARPDQQSPYSSSTAWVSANSSGDVLQELVVLVDELDGDPVAISGGDPRQQQPKLEPAVSLMGSEPLHR